MMHAYQEIYLTSCINMLGDAFDYAINKCNIPGNDFIKMFLSSSICKRIEKEDPSIIIGRSGIENAIMILDEASIKYIPALQYDDFQRSIEYWIGYSVGYYCFYTSRPFKDVFNVLSYDDLRIMYNTLHEADITKFCDIVNEKINNYYKNTNLKRIRTLYGITQKELSVKSLTSLRSIQMYEQRQKDINKASALTLYNISRVLGCSIEDLIER